LSLPRRNNAFRSKRNASSQEEPAETSGRTGPDGAPVVDLQPVGDGHVGVVRDNARVRKEPMDRESWRGLLDDWCRLRLGASIRTKLFVAGWQSAVIGLELVDGRRVVVKIRPPAAGLAGRLVVHRDLWRQGFRCPQPLTDHRPIGRFTASAEELVEGAGSPDDAAAAVPELAAVLAELVQRASREPSVTSLGEPPDWAGWNHSDRSGAWPRARPGEVDLNGEPEPRWFAALVGATRQRLLDCALAPVVGHVDWEPSNLGWTGSSISAVYDWDSLTELPEAAIAGLAAAVHKIVDDGPGSTVEQTERFLAAYAEARAEPWTAEEHQIAWSAGLWVLAFNAKAEMVDGMRGPHTRHLRSELNERARLAGLVGDP
jgi:hypothetical protein